MTTADELITDAKALLLDFDGPVTALMPPPLNAQAADQARAVLDGIELPDAIAKTQDHLAVLRYAADHVAARLPIVERACTLAEVACARRSEPSPEVRRLLADANARAVPVAIVSNNSEAAVRVFLDRFDWARGVNTLACRTPARVSQMKPDPYLVILAARRLGADARHCVLVGDSVSDVAAAHAAGTLVIGLAKTPQRGLELKSAGADALIFRSPKQQPR